MTARVRVVSYNIHSFKDDLHALAGVVADLAPDVLIVQEGARRFRWRQKNAALADQLRMVVGGGGLWSLGNLVLTTLRVRVLETRDVRYPLVPGHHLRGAVFATCAVPGARFVVTGSHLSTDPAVRPAQAAAWRAEMRRGDLPVVAAGDLNAEPGDPTWAAVADGLHIAGTAPTHPSSGPRRAIDGVFVDKRIEVAGFRVVDSAQARRASDHLPIAVDLVIPD
ncbi:Metal-dependent hydrolase, endonuclease/exonuclease/phosphatase family [Asanoa hainanensis]|uniref:Metal-dependent hydrolase, endonuclease/exonuclease/phosphatase family n=1 Tax=Asanoa hainanensis TaxID=560556 RepID=A0A239NEA2_9ACTN|nr:endonuclease/exonuclease/phosphatase family protein [Asanoa hainanensis]SNT52469.1 Metal-dependent hydrolase, endonuclease/exonuclease/phosphatase family [Asanoa hainanensis]